MKQFTYILLGICFGIVLYKSEAASWFRIYEMFRFESFHMYGIIGSAVATGALGIFCIKKYRLYTFDHQKMALEPKNKSFPRYLWGGVIFGLGWALVGACPGPMFILVGAGFMPLLVVIFGALIGTFLYGLLRKYLPH